MRTQAHGANTRRPVFAGTRRVSGLFSRTLANGSTVFEASLRLSRELADPEGR